MAPHAVFSRHGRRLLIAFASCFVVNIASAQSDVSNDAQRHAFKQAYAAALQGGSSWQTMASGLRSYPLYPYLPAAAMEHDIQQLDISEVQAYLKQYPDLIPAADLRRNFLLELARRQDWTNFLALAQANNGSDTLTCDSLQATLAQGGKLDFDRDLGALWAEASLPSACDPVMQAAHDQGLLTDARLWARIDRAAEAGKSNTISTLAAWLPSSEAAEAKRLALALNDPATAAAQASTWPNTPRSQQAAALALQKLARRQSGTADTAWQNLQQHFQFTPPQRDSVLNALALFHATDFDAGALQRLIALAPSAQSTATRDWRARVAISQQNWQAVLAAIDAMPSDQQQSDEWRYFRARALVETGQPDAAQAVYASLATQTGYFAFLSADHLGVSYSICSTPLTPNPQQAQTLLANPGMQRALELFAVDQPKMARREWTQALADADATTLQQAVALADQRGWYDRAVFTFNTGAGINFYEQRFPIAAQYGVVQQAKEAGIDPSWAYGILRAESAWMTDAHSGADARGLMQLVPATAQHVASNNGLPWDGGDSLYDPNVNIELGTRYLAQMAARFDGAPWLASAAYNAGPNRVDQWVAARSSLPPDLFVATIPFKETREYVARVMLFSVIYDWRVNGNVTPMSSRMPAIGQPYSLASTASTHKNVICAAPITTPAPAAPASSAPATEPARIPTRTSP